MKRLVLAEGPHEANHSNGPACKGSCWELFENVEARNGSANRMN